MNRVMFFHVIRNVLLFLIMTLAMASQIYSMNQVEERDPKLIVLEKFLINQFDVDVGLVRESPDESINRTYWLLGDNLLAYNALKDREEKTANLIFKSLKEYGFFQDGLHEALFGYEIPLPPYTPRFEIIEEQPFYTIKTEVRNTRESKIMDDWTDYADLLLYASMGFYNINRTDKALYYFNMAKEMWNEAGLYDKSTRQDGYYTTHKLALLLFVSHVLNQSLTFRSLLEDRIWRMQRNDGGIRSHYLGNLTSDREANSETASLVLIAYNYEEERLEEIREAEEDAERREVMKIQKERNRLNLIIAVSIIVWATSPVTVLITVYRKRRQ